MKFHLINYIKAQIEWAKGFFSEDNGKSSNKRLLSSLVIGTFIIPYFKVSIASQKLEDIPTGWMIMIASILGLNILDWIVKGYIGKINPPTNPEQK